MPRREFSPARLEGMAARTHKQPWLRCANVIPWLEKIAPQLERFADLPAGQFIEAVRAYVYHTAKFTQPNQMDRYPNAICSLDEILAGIYTSHTGGETVLIPLFCQACALAMGAILEGFGILCRETAIMSTNGSDSTDSLLTHAVLEVWNAELEHWELQDPFFNLAYGLKTETGVRAASSWELFAKPPTQIVCIIAEDCYFDAPPNLRRYHLKLAVGNIEQGIFNIIANNYLSYNTVVILGKLL